MVGRQVRDLILDRLKGDIARCGKLADYLVTKLAPSVRWLTPRPPQPAGIAACDTDDRRGDTGVRRRLGVRAAGGILAGDQRSRCYTK